MFTGTKKLFICSYKTNLDFLIIFCRMEPFHLLEPYCEEKHRGRLTAEGEVTTHVVLVIFSLRMYLNVMIVNHLVKRMKYVSI
jgi:hypothetical protein